MEISEPLTYEQMCERYPKQHVYMVEIDWVLPRGSAEFHTARVIAHSANRREASEQAMAWVGDRKIEFFHRYTVPFSGQYNRPIVIIDDELRNELHARR